MAIRASRVLGPGCRQGGIAMSRKTLTVLARTGLALTVVLAVAGGLLLWGSTYVHNSVQNQLAAQQVFFPPKAAFAHPKVGTEITPNMIPSVSQYAGQQLLTGQQAEAYADHFIADHLHRRDRRVLAGGHVPDRRRGRVYAPPGHHGREDRHPGGRHRHPRARGRMTASRQPGPGTPARADACPGRRSWGLVPKRVWPSS